ncbi:MAG: hypothetical protein JNM61_02670 [Zoogloeaceae bacterium]|nr:hypothetical protein [Zoogloeaceae bacterium]
MNVVCNNPVMYVVDYPAIESVEVIDKRRGRGALIRNGAARRFLRELEGVSASESVEDFEAVLAHYEALLTQPAIYH